MEQLFKRKEILTPKQDITFLRDRLSFSCNVGSPRERAGLTVIPSEFNESRGGITELSKERLDL